jgi:tripartite-type tricarboxylate transporter receptor subunit TctC
VKADIKPSEPKPATSPVAKAGAKPAASPAARPGFDEKAVADFYRGKTVKFIVGSAAGGGFDLYARIVARHMPRYLPGSPTMIVENRPGGGTLLTANTVYNTEPKDGTVIGTFAENLVLSQALGKEGIQFDAAKYQWLGSATKGRTSCLARTDTGIRSLQDTIGGKELVVGTDGPGSNIHDVPAILKAALGANLKLVPGYGGAGPLLLATESKEVDGYCGTFNVMATSARSQLEGSSPTARIIAITGEQKPDHPLLKETPTGLSLAKTEEAKELLRAGTAPEEMAKPYAVAPGAPADRVAALSDALARTFADQEFAAEIVKAGQDVVPASDREVTRTVQSLLNTPAPILAKLKDILK